MRNSHAGRLLIVAMFGSALATAPASAGQQPSAAGKAAYCAVAQSEFGGPPRVLNFDVNATALTNGVAAISELNNSLLRTKAVAPPEVRSTYRNSLRALRTANRAWRVYKTASNPSQKQLAYVRFSSATSALHAGTAALKRHTLTTCSTIAAPVASTVARAVAPTNPAPVVVAPVAPAPTPTVVVVAVPAPAGPPVASTPTVVVTPVVVTPVAPTLAAQPTPVPQPQPTPAPQPTAPQTTAPQTTPQPSGNASSLLVLVNQARSQGRSCGGTALAAAASVAWDTRLEEAARSHSAYQSQVAQLTHTGANGSNAGQRITAAGFPWNYWGENVGWNYPSPTAMLAGWLTSPGHCSQIMDSRFTHVGWARVGAYETMVLGRLA